MSIDSDSGGGEYEPPRFDFDGWLATREQDPNFVLVELGHGANPVALTQSFEDHRAYIGIEAWASKTYFTVAQERIMDLRRSRPTENIFFLSMPDSGNVESQDDVTTLLPDGAADEVLLSNVLGDPNVRQRPDGIAVVLAEAMRLIGDDGKVVVRETMTPFFFMVLETVFDLELNLEAVSSRRDSSWEKMSGTYSVQQPIGDGDFAPASAFYMILSKSLHSST